ncbi:MAG: hypothetical protein ACQER4_08415 [Bacteroidota bacterium]
MQIVLDGWAAPPRTSGWDKGIRAGQFNSEFDGDRFPYPFLEGAKDTVGMLQNLSFSGNYLRKRYREGLF